MPEATARLGLQRSDSVFKRSNMTAYVHFVIFNDIMLSLKTEPDVLREVAKSLRAHRLALGWCQADLAERSGVVIATLRRFDDPADAGVAG
jgi:ribosome-binding protein aMBF1 (putative translation factor)